MLSNILNIYCKNIFNNFLIVKSCRTYTYLFQKLPSPASTPAPESRNALVLHRLSPLFYKIKNKKDHIFWDCSHAKDTWALTDVFQAQGGAPFVDFLDVVWNLVEDRHCCKETSEKTITVASLG